MPALRFANPKHTKHQSSSLRVWTHPMVTRLLAMSLMSRFCSPIVAPINAYLKARTKAHKTKDEIQGRTIVLVSFDWAIHTPQEPRHMTAEFADATLWGPGIGGFTYDRQPVRYSVHLFAVFDERPHQRAGQRTYICTSTSVDADFPRPRPPSAFEKKSPKRVSSSRAHNKPNRRKPRKRTK